jgi:ABC-type microcin C transport system permease subunit YejB
MYTNNALMFPYHVIPEIKTARGPAWKTLVERIALLPETSDETLALMLTMVRINGCMNCETDSYRAMRGCAACAIQILRRYKGDDNELIEQYEQALKEVRQFARSRSYMGITSDVDSERNQ